MYENAATVVVHTGDGNNTVTIDPGPRVPVAVNTTSSASRTLTAGVGDTLNGGAGTNYLDGSAAMTLSRAVRGSTSSPPDRMTRSSAGPGTTS